VRFLKGPKADASDSENSSFFREEVKGPCGARHGLSRMRAVVTTSSRSICKRALVGKSLACSFAYMSGRQSPNSRDCKAHKHIYQVVKTNVTEGLNIRMRYL
jgi:hypothetical protein